VIDIAVSSNELGYLVSTEIRSFASANLVTCCALHCYRAIRQPADRHGWSGEHVCDADEVLVNAHKVRHRE
jgi:hypothetical protein